MTDEEMNEEQEKLEVTKMVSEVISNALDPTMANLILRSPVGLGLDVDIRGVNMYQADNLVTDGNVIEGELLVDDDPVTILQEIAEIVFPLDLFDGGEAISKLEKIGELVGKYDIETTE